jgi:hypothetical protein
MLRITDVLKNIFNTIPSLTSSVLASIQIPDISTGLYPIDNHNDQNDCFKFVKMSWKCIAGLKQGNPEMMLLSFKNIINMKKNSYMSAIHVLILNMIPYLQLWRLLQIEKTSGKGDVLNINDFTSRLWLPSVEASYALCNVLGLKVVIDNNTSNTTVELKSTQSISLNVLKAL